MEKTIKVIGICGKKRAGKDTVGEIIQKNINHYSCIYHMAKPLKESVKILYDLNYEQLHGFSKDIIDDRWGLSPRQIMQKFGTDILRNQIDKDFFIIHLDHFLKVKNSKNNMNHTEVDAIIVPDIRFQNEIDYIKNKWNGKIIRVTREQGMEDPHPSERDILELQNIDFTIDNNYSLLDLTNSTLNIINQLYKK